MKLNNEIEIRFPNGHRKNYQAGCTLEEIASSISPSLKKRSVVGKANGLIVDLRHKIYEDTDIEFYDLHTEIGLQVMRHTAAHITAQAIKRLYKNVSLGTGPISDNGFYYDVHLPHTLTEKDLVKIEKEMYKIISEKIRIQRKEVSYEVASEIFSNDHLKLDILENIPKSEALTIYQQGEFADLCRGPHLPSTNFLKAFKLTHISGAYWRGDSKNSVLQRIYGIAFSTEKELDEYQQFIEEAKKRNHRKIGKDLELFMFSEESPGMPFYLANGQIIRNELEGFLRDLQTSYEYKEVRTPLMMNQRLWEQSGHWQHYKDNMYFTQVDNQKFALKPMNCPGHMLIYKNGLHSYRDLPIRMAEFGQVHRHEFSGSLNGLLRVRTFCQDDAHIFVTPQQIESEITLALQIIDHVYKVFGFEYDIELSTRPEDYMGDLYIWNQAESALDNVLNRLNLPYTINEGDGAFYGPKIDIHIKDAINRSHQCATIQLDFQLPEKFDLTYINEENEKVRPVVIHRAVFGSIDRFLGILIEHFSGAFPLWLSPIQIQIIPVSNELHKDYATLVQQKLRATGIRTELITKNEKLSYKIREAQLKKIPFILVVGDQEQKNKSVNVREFGKPDSNSMDLDGFIEYTQKIIEMKIIK